MFNKCCSQEMGEVNLHHYVTKCASLAAFMADVLPLLWTTLSVAVSTSTFLACHQC